MKIIIDLEALERKDKSSKPSIDIAIVDKQFQVISQQTIPIKPKNTTNISEEGLKELEKLKIKMSL